MARILLNLDLESALVTAQKYPRVLGTNFRAAPRPSGVDDANKITAFSLYLHGNIAVYIRRNFRLIRSADAPDTTSVRSALNLGATPVSQ